MLVLIFRAHLEGISLLAVICANGVYILQMPARLRNLFNSLSESLSGRTSHNMTSMEDLGLAFHEAAIRGNKRRVRKILRTGQFMSIICLGTSIKILGFPEKIPGYIVRSSKRSVLMK